MLILLIYLCYKLTPPPTKKNKINKKQQQPPPKRTPKNQHNIPIKELMENYIFKKTYFIIFYDFYRHSLVRLANIH